MIKLNTEQLKMLNDGIRDGLIKFQTSPCERYKIYNYTEKAQFGNDGWNEVTLMCRGLILDVDYNIIARPFTKFFNSTQPEVDNSQCVGDFTVYEKMDGSLVISTFYDGELIVASRGSFESEQAIKAREIINEKYYDEIKEHDHITYCFEIIYPENRIVVDYGKTVDLVLIGAFNTKENIDIRVEHILKPGFNVVKTYPIYSLEDIPKILENKNNFEGFVIRFDSGYRVKMKSEEYKRLHRLVTGVSKKDIWEFMCTLEHDCNLEDIDGLSQRFICFYNHIPDKLYEFVKDSISEYVEIFFQKMNDACNTFCYVDRICTRKYQAKYIMDNVPELSGIIFRMLDIGEYGVKENFNKYMKYVLKDLKPVGTEKFWNIKKSEDKG